MPSPRISAAAPATLNTASPRLTLVRQRGASIDRGTPDSEGTTSTASSPIGGSKRCASAVHTITNPPWSAASGVVGVALELRASAEHVGVQLEHVVGRQQPGHGGRGARAQPAGQSGISELMRNSKSSAGMQALESP